MGNDTDYWYESATSHAVVYFLQQGTPFIYQGQEIGMTNYPFDSIETFNDVAVKMNIKSLKNKVVTSINYWINIKWKTETMLVRLCNGITKNAGFTDGQPWFPVNPNYKEINVADQQEDAHSVLNFYKSLIQLKNLLIFILMVNLI